MSKTSAKQRYIQFSSWLSTFKKSTANTTKKQPQRASKMEHYKAKGGR